MDVNKFMQLYAQRDKINVILSEHPKACELMEKLLKLQKKKEQLKRDRFRKTNELVKRVGFRKLYQNGVWEGQTQIKTLINKYTEKSNEYKIETKKSLIWPFLFDRYIEISGLEPEEKYEKRKERVESKLEDVISNIEEVESNLKAIFEDGK